MIAIVNYGLGNLGSVANMLRYLGIPARIINRPEALADAHKIILPGVGAFDDGMKMLTLSWKESLNKRVMEEQVPVLGICLGMQLMTRSSEEGTMPGLGWIDAVTQRIKPAAGSSLKVPHMGWAYVEETNPAYPTPLPENSRFYFAHSYHVKLTDNESSWLQLEYGEKICVGYKKNNILGVQFHPEKSHRYGMDFLKKFSDEFWYD